MKKLSFRLALSFLSNYYFIWLLLIHRIELCWRATRAVFEVFQGNEVYLFRSFYSYDSAFSKQSRRFSFPWKTNAINSGCLRAEPSTPFSVIFCDILCCFTFLAPVYLYSSAFLSSFFLLFSLSFSLGINN